MLVVHAKDVGGVEDDVEQDERAEEPEEGVGDDGGPKSRIGAHATDLGEELAGHVPVKTARGIGGGDFADAKGNEQAEDGESEEDESGEELAAMKGLREKAACEGSEEGGEFDDAVAPTEF